MIERTEGSDFEIPWELICRAVDRIGKTSNKDANGVCVLVIRAFIFGNWDAARKRPFKLSLKR